MRHAMQKLVMKRAWEIHRQSQSTKSFKKCLEESWSSVKENKMTNKNLKEQFPTSFDPRKGESVGILKEAREGFFSLQEISEKINVDRKGKADLVVHFCTEKAKTGTLLRLRAGSWKNISTEYFQKVSQNSWVLVKINENGKVA